MKNIGKHTKCKILNRFLPYTRQLMMRGKRRTRLYALVAAACLAFFGVVFLGVSVFGTGDGLLGRITEPITKSDRDPASDFVYKRRSDPARTVVTDSAGN